MNLEKLTPQGRVALMPHTNDPDGQQAIYRFGRMGVSVIESPLWMRRGVMIEIAVVEFVNENQSEIHPMTVITDVEMLGDKNGFGTYDFYSLESAAEFIEKARGVLS